MVKRRSIGSSRYSEWHCSVATLRLSDRQREAVTIVGVPICDLRLANLAMI